MKICSMDRELQPYWKNKDDNKGSMAGFIKMIGDKKKTTVGELLEYKS